MPIARSCRASANGGGKSLVFGQRPRLDFRLRRDLVIDEEWPVESGYLPNKVLGSHKVAMTGVA